MQIKKAKAAILRSREPLIVDEIELPETLDVGQVLVKVLYTTICGAQLNEIAAAKGPDKFLPHLLGHEASAKVLEIGPGVSNMQARRYRRAALAAEPWHPVQAAVLQMAWKSVECRMGDDIQRICRHFRKQDDTDTRRLRSQESRPCSAVP